MYRERHSESVLTSFTINFDVIYIIYMHVCIEKRFEFMRSGGLLTLPPPPPGKSLHEFIHTHKYIYISVYDMVFGKSHLFVGGVVYRVVLMVPRVCPVG